jgi:hypothetical protein
MQQDHCRRIALSEVLPELNGVHANKQAGAFREDTKCSATMILTASDRTPTIPPSRARGRIRRSTSIPEIRHFAERCTGSRAAAPWRRDARLNRTTT